MKVFRSITEIPADLGPTVVSIGNFDGVHLGHRSILAAVIEDARARHASAVAITFDPHPQQYLRPDLPLALLAPMPERLRLLAQTGIDVVVVLPFDAAFCQLRARSFVEEILVRKLGVCSIHEGENFRFGYRAEAGVEELSRFGREVCQNVSPEVCLDKGFVVTVHPPVRLRQSASCKLEVSSSAIRERLLAGDLRTARRLLGRPFAVRSTPARGRGIGSRLLVPTVNLAAYDGLLPAAGVYVTRLTIGESDSSTNGGSERDGSGRRIFRTVTNVGNRPTFADASFAVESHILDFAPVDLNEETPLELEFLMRLRPEIKWPSPDALRSQILRDVARAQRYFSLLHSL